MVAGGKALGILVAGGQLTVAAIGLAAPTLTVDPTNPTSVAPASPVTLRWTIHDPSHFLEGAGGMRLWWTTDATAGNATGVQVAGSLSGSVGDNFSYMATFTAPSGASTLHYQFGEVSQAFNNLDGLVFPFLVLPDRNTGASRLALSVSAPSTGASVQVSNIPSIATGVVVVVDLNDATYRVQQNLPEGATSLTTFATGPLSCPCGVGRVRHPSRPASSSAPSSALTMSG